MKKIFNFTKKKKDANTSDTGSVHSVGYELKDKDLGKVHKAALVGDLSKLRQHVKKNDINQLDKENRTALHIACANGHAEVVQFLAESKANLNLRDNQNRSPMMKAVQCQHAQCLVPLLEHNADPNLVDINGNSALHLAADIPSMPITMLLLEHDANINIKNKAGFTPLTISINGNHVEIAEFLLKEGADVNTKDHELRTPLMMAACSGHISMVRLLLQHNADITLKDTNGWSSDDYAVMNGNHACSHLIIEYETKRNTIPPSSLTTPRKKKKDSDMGSPSKGVDASFSLGGPATDKDDDEDISQSDSISRASKRANDDWPSSDEEDELDSSHQKPQKLNLKKIIAATKGKNGDNGAELADSWLSDQPSGSQLKADSIEGYSEREESQGGYEDDQEESDVDYGDDAFLEDDDCKEGDEEDEAKEKEESNNSIWMCPGKYAQKDKINDDTTGTSEIEGKYKAVEGADVGLLVTAKHTTIQEGNKGSVINSKGNSEMLAGCIPVTIDFEDDCVVSAIRVESRISDEDDDVANQYRLPAESTTLQHTTEAHPEKRLEDFDDGEVNKERDSVVVSWGERAKPLCTMRNKMDVEDNGDTIGHSTVLVHDSAGRKPEMEDNSGDTFNAQHCIEVKEDTIHQSSWGTTSDENEECHLIDETVEETPWEKSNSDGMSNKDMPHIDTDGVDADSSEEEDFQKTGQSQVRGLEKLVKVNDQVKYPIKKVKDDEERNEDEEAKGNIKDNAEEEEHSYFISSQNLPERNISQDKERDFLTELGLEKGDNEDSWDSESFSGSPKKQHGDTLSPEMKKVTALEESQQAVLNDNAQTISDHDGGDGNGPIDKKEKMKKEPLSVLNQLEQVADKNTDFMEELGLGEVDDLEEPTDWDTASTTSKGSAFGRKEIPPRVKKLEGGSAQFPVPLPSVKKIEEDSPSVENSAAKLDPPPIELSLGAPEKESSPEPEFDAENSENGLEEQKPVLEVEQNETGQSQKEQKLEATESFNHPSASSPKRSISGGHERRQSTCETTMAEDFDELTLSTDTASDDIEPPNSGYCHASLLFKQLELTNLDSVNMVKLQNMFHEYERTIQNEKNHHGRLTDKLRCMESVKGELQSNLEDMKDQKLTLEHKLLELQTDINNLKFQLKQEQQKHRNASMMYENTKEQLQRKEEQHSLEAEERQKLELSLRNLELEMRAITNNMKQLEEDHGETQRLLAQERSSRALQENLLKNHLRKQQDSEEDNRSKSNEALSQLTEASDRERELLQQIAVLQDELSCLRKDLELSCSHRQQEECRLTEENKTLKERLEDHRRNFKLKEEDFAQTVFQYNGQLAVLKTEQAMAATRLEHEQQIRQQLELEVESANSRLAGALQEATLCQAARAESEKDLQRKKEEIIRIQDKCMGEMTSQRESIGDLSQKLSKMEVRANSLENEVHRTHLQLTEKTLLLDMLQQEKEQSTYRIKELETTLHAEREQASEAGARQGAVRERLAQAQSEAMLLRQQLEDSQNRAVGKETAVIDAQKSFSDILAQLRLDCEDRVQLVEERSKELAGTAANLREQVYNLETEKNSRETESRQLQQELADALKKLSMSEASLEVNTRYRSDLEEEKVHLLKDINEQKKKQEESAAAYVQAEQRINTLKTSFENKEQELTSANQKLEGALLDTAGLYKTIKQLEEAVQRLEIENARLEGGKHQSNTIAALQKAGQEVTSVEMEKKRAKKIMEQQKSVDLRLDQEMKRNTDLQKEVYRLRSLLKTTKKKLKEKDGAGAEFASSSSVRGENGGHGHSEVASGRMKDKGEELQGRLEKEVAHGSQMKRSNAQLNEHLAKKCPRCSKEGLQKSRKQADDEVSERWWQVESGLLDQSQTEQYHQNAEERVRKEIKQKLEEVNIFLQTQAASQEALDQIKAKNEASLQSHLELRIQDLEDQLVRARSSQHESQHNSTHTELERYRDLYNEELRHRKALAAKLERLNDKSLVSSSIANGSMGGPLLEIGSFASTGLEPKNRSMSFGSPVCNLMTDGQSNRIEAYLAKFQNEMAINISKELKQASAELQADYSGSMFPLGSPKNLETERDPISRATQQYMEVLKKNFMI